MERQRGQMTHRHCGATRCSEQPLTSVEQKGLCESHPCRAGSACIIHAFLIVLTIQGKPLYPPLKNLSLFMGKIAKEHFYLKLQVEFYETFRLHFSLKNSKSICK